MAGKIISKDFFSVFILVFVLFIIVISLIYLNKDELSADKITQENETLFDTSTLKSVANSSLDVVKMLSKGGTIVDGPRKVDDIDRKNIPSLFYNIDGELYIIKVSDGQNSIFVVMNQSDILKTVPLSLFS